MAVRRRVRPVLSALLPFSLVLLIACAPEPAPPQPIPESAVSMGGGDSPPPSGGPAAAPSRTAAPAGRTPTATRVPAPAGAVASIEGVRQTWEAKGLQVTVGGASQGFSGFAVTPIDVRVGRAGEGVELAAMRYESQQALQQDWDTSQPSAVAPRAGRSAPPHVAVWWSGNMVLVVTSRDGAVGNEVREAFLSG